VRTVAKNLTVERKRQAGSTPLNTTATTAQAEPDPSEPRHIQAYTGADGLIYYRTP
jgi:hypothetical protein